MPTVFVYGSLMLHPEALATGRSACLEDHAVRFTVPGFPPLEPAFANLEPAPGERAWGVVAEWSESAWRRARRAERPYDVRTIAVRVGGDEPRAALAFFLVAAPLAREKVPSGRYARKLWRGAEHHGLPDDVVARYRALAERGSPWTRRLEDLLRRGG